MSLFKKQERKTTAPQREVAQELQRLRTFDEAPGMTQEQQAMLYGQQVLTESMADKTEYGKALQAKMAVLKSEEAADGIPEEMLKPATKSKCMTAEQEKLTKKARQGIDPREDFESYKILDYRSKMVSSALLEMDEMKENSVELKSELINRQSVDRRVMKIFCTGHKKGKDGNPLNVEESSKKARDERFLEEYCSNDLQRREPYLEDMTKEILSIHFSKEELTRDYFIAHPAQMKDKANKLVYFENVTRDPINKPFFARQDQDTQRRVNAQLDAMITYSGLLNLYCSELGFFLDRPEELVGVRATQIYTEEDKQGIQERIMETVRKNDRLEMELAVRQKERELSQQRIVKDDNQFQAVMDMDEFIKANPETYQKKKSTVNHLYQNLYKTLYAQGDMTGKLNQRKSAIEEMTKRQNLNPSESTALHLLQEDATQMEMELNVIKEREVTLEKALRTILQGKKTLDIRVNRMIRRNK